MAKSPDEPVREPSRRAFRLVNALLRRSMLTVSEAREFTQVGLARTRTIIAELVDEVDCAELAPGSPTRVRLAGVRHGVPSHEVAIAACFAATLAPLFEGTKLETGMREGLRYVVDAGPRREKFDHLERKFFFVRGGGETALPSNGKLLEGLTKAILEQRLVALTHRKFDADAPPGRETYEPLSIAIYDHQLYLLGRRERDRAMRLLRFSRITKARTLARTFEYPSELEFSPRQLFAQSFGVYQGETSEPAEAVEIRLHRRWAGYAKDHRWHRSQSVEIRDEGVTVRLTVRVCPELKGWILSFGDEAEVISPQALREEISSRAQKLASLYRSPTNRRSSRPGRTGG